MLSVSKSDSLTVSSTPYLHRYRMLGSLFVASAETTSGIRGISAGCTLSDDDRQALVMARSSLSDGFSLLSAGQSAVAHHGATCLAIRFVASIMRASAIIVY